MSRPRIEFIFAQTLPWLSDRPLPGRPGTRTKVLSEDDRSGAISSIVEFPAGFSNSFASDMEEELYVLDGSLTLDDTTLERDGYASIARGRETSWSSDKGGVALLWRDTGDLNEPGALSIVDTLAVPWDTSPTNKDGYPNPARKVLRADRKTGEYLVFLLATEPHNHPAEWRERPLEHPCVEECFVLAGAFDGPEGVMAQGGYFWRPPGILHGPFGSRDGCLALFRFMEGDHVNIWGKDYLPFKYGRPYQPILPDGTPEDVMRGYDPALRF